jgi:hypothetical protein
VHHFLEDLRNGDDTLGSSPSVAAATAVAFTAIVSSAARLAQSLRFVPPSLSIYPFCSADFSLLKMSKEFVCWQKQ